MKKIKKIMSKMPTDPFEAELLALAGGLVGKKDGEEQFSDDSDYMATDDEEDEANDGRGQVSQSAQLILHWVVLMRHSKCLNFHF